MLGCEFVSGVQQQTRPDWTRQTGFGRLQAVLHAHTLYIPAVCLSVRLSVCLRLNKSMSWCRALPRRRRGRCSLASRRLVAISLLLWVCRCFNNYCTNWQRMIDVLGVRLIVSLEFLHSLHSHPLHWFRSTTQSKNTRKTCIKTVRNMHTNSSAKVAHIQR